ncbi:MAG: rhodanese-like domain-containing protein [Halofilum sp. (in: g-proteobacteria)]|nr:rhodanese-like domain-containing protein [Halofilum sp. (in: g-proteobacteria)]
MMGTSLLTALRGLAVAALGFVPGVVLAEPAALVSGDWLVANRDDVHIVETAKSVDAFEQSGHIEGASFVPYARVAVEQETTAGSVRYLLPDPEAFSEVMREAGVSGDDRVVIAPSGTSVYGDMTVAARLYWAMRYYGHGNVVLLDGGVAAWRKTGGDTVAEPATVEPGDFTARVERPEIHVSAEDVEAILEDGSMTLTDNRPLEQFTGLFTKDYVQTSGHLPGAVPVPFTLFAVSRDGIHYWRSPEEVQRVLTAMGIAEADPVVAYCNSGHVSAMAWFAISEVGGHGGALYDGSLHEWTRTPERAARLVP